MPITIIAAVSENGFIGNQGRIPWNIPSDLARFKKTTTPGTVIMGRRTWDSIPDKFRPLPERQNIVVTRQTEWSAEGCEITHSLDSAITLANKAEIFIIGGGELYADALPIADVIRLTRVYAHVEGNVRFPSFVLGGRGGWHLDRKKSEEAICFTSGDDFATQLFVYKRTPG